MARGEEAARVRQNELLGLADQETIKCSPIAGCRRQRPPDKAVRWRLETSCWRPGSIRGENGRQKRRRRRILGCDTLMFDPF